LKPLEENIEKTFEDIGTGNTFLNSNCSGKNLINEIASNKKYSS
jgi:hypothetical protein